MSLQSQNLAKAKGQRGRWFKEGAERKRGYSGESSFSLLSRPRSQMGEGALLYYNRIEECLTSVSPSAYPTKCLFCPRNGRWHTGKRQMSYLWSKRRAEMNQSVRGSERKKPPQWGMEERRGSQ